jgi:uncharacterized membrane protein YfcA
MPILILAAIVVLAQTVETATGFGSTILALSLGAQLYPVEKLVPPLVLIGIAQSGWLVARWHKSVDWRLLLSRILPICAIGLAAGRCLGGLLHGGTLKIILAAFVIVVSLAELVQLYRGRSGMPPMSAARGSALLLAGGFIHGIFATGGPAVVYYAGRNIRDKAVFRATLSALWLILNLLLLGTWLAGQGLETGSAAMAVCLLPSLIIGILLGEMLHGKVKENTFRGMVFSLLLVTGIFLLI